CAVSSGLRKIPLCVRSWYRSTVWLTMFSRSRSLAIWSRKSTSDFHLQGSSDPRNPQRRLGSDDEAQVSSQAAVAFESKTAARSFPGVRDAGNGPDKVALGNQGGACGAVVRRIVAQSDVRRLISDSFQSSIMKGDAMRRSRNPDRIVVDGHISRAERDKSG